MMAYDHDDSQGITGAVTRFLERHIESVEQLEILLRMRSDQERDWTLEALSAELRTSILSVNSRLVSLQRSGLVNAAESNGNIVYRYGPLSTEDEATVERLENCYRVHRTTIIRLIFSKPIDKISVYANSFLVRKDPKNG